MKFSKEKNDYDWPIKLHFLLWWWFLFVLFLDSVFLCRSGWPGTHYVTQAGLKLSNLLPSTPSGVLKLQA